MDALSLDALPGWALPAAGAYLFGFVLLCLPGARARVLAATRTALLWAGSATVAVLLFGWMHIGVYAVGASEVLRSAVRRYADRTR